MSSKTKIWVGWAAGGAIVPLLAALSFAAPADDLRLVDAVKNRDRAAVRSLIEQHVNVNAAQPDGTTALAWAVSRDDLETADLLIRASANVNMANDYGVTPLSLACTNRSTPIVERLLKAGACAHGKCRNGEIAAVPRGGSKCEGDPAGTDRSHASSCRETSGSRTGAG